MPSAVPLWVPLAVAFVGVAGTLAASVLTQLLNRRRDDKLWERERAERSEQWRREDAAKWLSERRAVYAEFLAVYDEWASVQSRAWQERRQLGAADEATRAALADMEKAGEKIFQTVRLIGAPEVAKCSQDLWLALGVDHGRVTDDAYAGDRELDYFDSLDMLEALVKAMRRDLGVDISR